MADTIRGLKVAIEVHKNFIEQAEELDGDFSEIVRRLKVDIKDAEKKIEKLLEQYEVGEVIEVLVYYAPFSKWSKGKITSINKENATCELSFKSKGIATNVHLDELRKVDKK